MYGACDNDEIALEQSEIQYPGYTIMATVCGISGCVIIGMARFVALLKTMDLTAQNEADYFVDFCEFELLSIAQY